MSYSAAIRLMPPDLQPAMIEFVEALNEHFREQYAVRRQDFEALQAAVEDLTKAQQRSEERLSRLETAITELAAAQQRTEQRLAELAEAQRQTNETLNRLIMRMEKREIQIDDLRGWRLERKYTDKAYAYFGRLVYKAKAVEMNDVLDELERHLSADEVDEVLLLDALIRGKLRGEPPNSDVWLALEVSTVIDEHDVERAERRARLLRRAGFATIPTVAGEQITDSALTISRMDKILVVQNGHRTNWPAALDHIRE